MSWTWRYEDDAGAVLDKPEATSFDSRSDAESWLGENFGDLVEEQVAAVSLMEGQSVVYGPMSLSAEA